MLCASSDVVAADETAGSDITESLKMTLFCAHLSCINMFELKAEECFPGALPPVISRSSHSASLVDPVCNIC